jgi:hypothetical protein
MQHASDVFSPDGRELRYRQVSSGGRFPKRYYPNVFSAQCALANKRNQKAWQIVRTENGWFTLEPR